jgi:threonine dehydrogenase-like Zn-dependent dehydrogenase
MMGSVAVLGGFDVVYDCVGTERTLTDALRWTRAGGLVALVGDQFTLLKVDLTPLWSQGIRLVAPAAHGRETWAGEEIGTFELAARLLQEGKLTGEGLITHRYPLSRWQEAVQAALGKRQSKSIKVAFTFE